MEEQLYIEEVTYSKYKVQMPEGRIIEIDDNFEHILGYTAAEICEKVILLQDIMLPEDWDTYYARVMQLFNTKGEGYLAHRLRTKSGEVIFVFCFGQIIGSDASGKAITEILITDITNTRMLQAQVEALSGLNADLNKTLAERNRTLESVLNNLAGGVCVLEINNRHTDIKYISDSFFKMFHITKEQMQSHAGDLKALILKEDQKKMDKLIQQTVVTNKTTIGEIRFIDLNEQGVLWIQVCLSLLSLQKGKLTLCAVFIDITQKKAEELEYNLQNELLKLVVEGSGERLLSYDIEADLLIVNHFDAGTLDEIYRNEAFLATIYEENNIYLSDRENIANLFQEMKAVQGKRSLEFRMRITEKGQFIWYRLLLVSIADNSGNIRKLVGKIYSVHDEKLQKQELSLRAERDSLTGIYNHLTFTMKVEAMLSCSYGSLCAFYMLDIDDFKMINDAFGHYEGDDLLCGTAAALEQLASMHGGFSGRLGGDEFAVFVPDIGSVEEAEHLAQKINHTLAEVTCKTVHTVSIGIDVLKITKELDFNYLYCRADQALYASKRHGKNRYMFYSDALNEDHQVSAYVNNSYAADDGYFLDDIEHIVYITDINTNEIYFMNKAALKSLKLSEHDQSWKHKKCYEVFQGLNEPCAFCTNHVLNKEKSYVWYHRNRLDHQDYILKDKVVDWHGKKCRMEMAINISDVNRITNILAERFEIEDALTSSLMHIATTQDYNYKYQKLLETLATFYGANHSCIFQYDDEQDCYYEWKTANATVLGEDLQLFLMPEIRARIEKAAGDASALVINHIQDIDDKDSPIYNFLLKHRIWSLYVVLIRNSENNLVGSIMIFNPQMHNGDIKLLNILALYIGNEFAKRKLWDAHSFELTHDSLTKTLNRSSYIKYAAQIKDLNSLGIVVMDVNEVRSITEDFGQAYSDHLLVSFVDKMCKMFPNNEIYRIGNDEFLITCENMDKDVFLEKVDTIRNQFQTGMFTACLGYIWDDFDIDIRRMEKHAYDMLYMEKQKWYESKDEHSYKWNTMTRRFIQDELKEGKFQIYLQPKVDYRTDRFYGAEALVRYDENEKLVNIIGRLENSRTIKYLDLYVLEQVCKMLHSWQEKQIPLIPVSCNFSRISILEDGMTEQINQIVEAYHVPKNLIEIEITESIGEMEHEMVARIANQLHMNGFRIAMDDFGTKYSNVSILASMKFDVIKLDRSMVYNIDKNEISKKILQHLIEMCKDIGVECIAEGVETRAQADILQEIGCNYIQGFLYSKPVNIDRFLELYLKNLGN